MIVRYGIYEGVVVPQGRALFDQVMGDGVIPALADLPGVAEVRLLRGLAPKGLTPTYHQLIELTFADEAALALAMNSDERRAVGPVQAPSLNLFRGRTPHANFQVVRRIVGCDP